MIAIPVMIGIVFDALVRYGIATFHTIPELILGLRPASERRRYFVTTSLIDWTQT